MNSFVYTSVNLRNNEQVPGFKRNARYISFDNRRRHFDKENEKLGEIRFGQKSGKEKGLSDAVLKKAFFAIITILSMLLLGEIGFHLFIAPNMRINTVRIADDGAIPLSNDDILRLAGVVEKEYYFNLNTEDIKERLESYPLIKSARVKKAFPDKLDINLTGRHGLGVALFSVGGTAVPVAFDEEGVVFQVGKSITNIDMPVISGIKIPELRLGMRMPAEFSGVLQDLYGLKESYPALFGFISEMKFVKKQGSRYEILLYPQDYTTRIRIGERIDADLLKYILMVLDTFDKQNLPLAEELDFRTGEVVFKMSEG